MAEWSNEAKALCKEFWQQGYSASRIANEISDRRLGTYSRNAVLGMLHRMKVAPRPKRPRAPYVRKPTNRKVSVPDTNNRPAMVPADNIEAALANIAALNAGPGIDFTDLIEGKCKAPRDDRGEDGMMRYCGNNTGDGAVYCPGHNRLFHQPREAVRRRYG